VRQAFSPGPLADTAARASFLMDDSANGSFDGSFSRFT